MSKSLYNLSVMSLRTGTRAATAIEPIINPHNLKILGWWCSLSSRGERLVLLAEDIREMMPSGLAVDDGEVLSPPQDLVRYREVLDTKFQLMDKFVRTKRQKLGKVADFSYNDGLFVQKLYVTRPITKIFSSQDTLLVDRTQILEVTDSYILVRDTEVLVQEKEMAPARAAATP